MDDPEKIQDFVVYGMLSKIMLISSVLAIVYVLFRSNYDE